MPVQVIFVYGTERHLVHHDESVPQLRDAVTEAKKNAAGGWVIFDTPDGGQTNIFVQPDVQVKIIRESR